MCLRLRPATVLALLCLSLATAFAHAQVLNEFVGNHTGADNFEFVEVLGAPNTDYSNLTVIQIEGDTGSDAGRISLAVAVGTTDADGLWWSGFLDDPTDHNDSYTYFLVDGFTGLVGQDLDAADDGTLDSTPWSSILDSVGVDDGGAGDHFYGAETTLAEFFDGASFSPGGASRLPNGSDTDQVADWTRNDWDGTGLPGLPGNLAPNEAVNTPGALNSTSLPPADPPIINEFVYDITGSDDVEYIEVFGDANADYSTAWLLLINGAGQADDAYQVGSTDASGLWTTGFLAETLPNDTVTTLLVEAWTGTIGQDLDTNDDGTLDVTPWTTVHDGVAVDHGAGFTYTAVVLDGAARAAEGVATPPGGASRIPHGADTDQPSDWQANDFEGGGLAGFVAVPTQGEAYNTPGAVNRTNSVDYYAAVDLSSQAQLRSTLHDAVDDHLRFPYSASTTDTWDILEEADEDPGNSSNILTVYKNSTIAKFGGGSGPYNREHTWPRTFGFPDQGTSSAYTDTHHLRLADPTYNSDRGSRIFGTCSAACTERTTDANNGTGGGSGTYPGNSNWFTGGDGNAGTWEAWDHRKGDVARSMLYMDIRYDGGSHGLTGTAEPDLVLTDDTGLIVSSGSNTTGTAYMGRLSVLLEWHAQDPPDENERRRNEVIYSYQGNRNPFVDHPQWAECLFNDVGCGTPLFTDGFESGDTTGWSAAAP